jgi:hypothetical protein
MHRFCHHNSVLKTAQLGITIQHKIQRAIRQCRRILRHVGNDPTGRNFQIAGLCMQVTPQ